jgi:peptide/nickel transport system substrate-binding protein
MKRRISGTDLSRRDFLRLAGLGFGAAAVGGFSRFSPSMRVARAQAARAGTLRVGWTPPTSLDPARYNDAPDISIGKAVYDYLINVNQGYQLIPGLAKSWVISEDGLEYTFTLQEGVTFRDGSEFSAEDVKFTYERLKTDSNASSLYEDVQSIDVVDPLTIKFVLGNPSASFLAALADYHAAILKTGTTDPTADFNGTGPFILEDVDVTARASFVANENYWQPGKPMVEALEMTFAAELPTLVSALQGGQLDWVARIPVELFSALQNDPNLTTINIPTNNYPVVRLHADEGPGADVRVRQALRLATDRAAAAEAIYGGLATPGQDTPIGPLYGDYFAEDVQAPARDVEAARALLAEAGFAEGLDLDFYLPQGEFNADELAQVLQQQWAEVGIRVTLRPTPPNIYYSEGPNNWLEAQLGLTNWATRPDPQVYLDVSVKTGAVYNEAKYSDPEVDALIDQARTETDVEARAEIMSDIQRILVERGPFIIPYFQPALAAQSANVSGIELIADPGLTSFADAVIAE